MKQSSNNSSSRKTSWPDKKLQCLTRTKGVYLPNGKTKLNEEKLVYNKIQNLLQQKITKAKINHQNKLCKSLNNCSPSLFWKTAKPFDLTKNKTNHAVHLDLKSDKSIITDNLKNANLFNLLFAKNSTLSDSEYLAQLLKSYI